MKMLKDFIGFYKPHRKLFYWDMVCAMVIALADLFYPTIARNIINVYVDPLSQKYSVLISIR